ncbi:hypothetical protein CEXT_207101 [Caerostris extrusa]|uniref:Uncharacterized protein n=1 Tax=Caerostris extrusa TaxID=172846 RepID=A0AAV4YDY6_CAEEX|nr:hypothetical protein CEXT_207101 [Caerostris extrusa]
MPFFYQSVKTLVVKDLLAHLFSKHLSMAIFLLATASLMQLGTRCITPCYYPINPATTTTKPFPINLLRTLRVKVHAVEYIYTVYTWPCP